MAFQYEFLDTPYSMYGIYQPMFGPIQYSNTQSYIDNQIQKNQIIPSVANTLSNIRNTRNDIKELENKFQSRPMLNSSIKQSQTVGGKIFRIKRKSKYL